MVSGGQNEVPERDRNEKKKRKKGIILNATHPTSKP